DQIDMATYTPSNSPWHPQPPEIQEPPAARSTPWEPGDERETDSGKPKYGQHDQKEVQPDWLKRAKDSFRFSTTYIDSNYRRQWDDSIRAFNNQHASDSKYNSEVYR